MKIIHAIIEPSKDGYGLYFKNPSLEGTTTFGLTLEEVKNNAREVLNDLLAVCKENDLTIPEELINGDGDKLKIKFSFDLRYYFNHMKYLNLTEFARKIGINSSLLRQYSKGLSYSSEDQFQNIREGLHSIGKELQGIRG